jgi:hypothetical protein
MSQQRPPPQFPDDDPGVPIEPAVAKARAAFVRSSLQKIKELRQQGKTPIEITEQLGRFAEDYPQLFKMALRMDPSNEASMRTMLAMLDRMGTGELSQHQASVIVGQRLYDTYVKPNIDETTK